MFAEKSAQKPWVWHAFGQTLHNTCLFFVQNRKTQFPENSVIFAKLSSKTGKTQFFRNFLIKYGTYIFYSY